jgi:hypothetical protein
LNVEKHKHRCAVRQLLTWRKQWGLKIFREYVQKSKFSYQVMRDFEDQWMKGNRGNLGEWL